MLFFICFFFNETICNFKKETEETIIPNWLFEEQETFYRKTSTIISQRKI